MICENISVSSEGHLLFAGQDTVELAKKYGTPLYLMDEDRIRTNCRLYKKAMRESFGDNAAPLYASKANCFKRIYEIMKEEDMGIDVVSSGEIYTAVKAGYDLSRAYFHSNNKTDEDIAYAMDNGIGYFVADNIEEVWDLSDGLNAPCEIVANDIVNRIGIESYKTTVEQSQPLTIDEIARVSSRLPGISFHKTL